MRILFIGDIVGQAGIKKVATQLPLLKEEFNFHFCIANAENAAEGLGLTSAQARELFSLGVDCITLGNHSFSKIDIFKIIGQDERIIRPANGSPAWPGRGYTLFKVDGVKILVMNLQGQVFLQTPHSPFLFMKENLPKIKKELLPDITLVDFHAEASSEKIALAHQLVDEVSVLVGTHTHIQTADECILAGSLAYITDVGMTGPYDGVIGMKKEVAKRRFLDNMPARYELAGGACCFSAVLIDVNPANGKAVQIMRIFDRPSMKGLRQWVKS